MNRILLAALALAAVGAGVYLLVDSSAPSPAGSKGTQVGAQDPGAPARANELADPKQAPRAAAELERPTDIQRAAGQPAAKAGATATASKPVEVSFDPGVPSSLPPTDDGDQKAFADKYAKSTPAERRQALESLATLYKDAAAGRIKGSEKLLDEIQAELNWLERNLEQ
ncbi:MAG: hypothetical protein HZA53_03905 [Planctomycetes bacterium]|nr:hypothetical protein [Planctomycetota bacterium]